MKSPLISSLLTYVALALTSISVALPDVSAVDLARVAENPAWRAIVDGTYDLIDPETDPQFFFSNSHSRDYLAELSATVRRISPETLCRFPGRYAFVRDFVDPSISFSHCSELQDFLSAVNGDRMSIVFASPYSGSPMSYFGHTFLLLHRPAQPQFSAAIGFAADIPDNTGPFELSWKGLTGSLPASFTVDPLFLLRHKYLTEEQRYLIRYETDFSAAEIERVLLFLYEVAPANYDYSFFSVNCTSELMPLLQVGRPMIDVDSRVIPVTYPSDLVELAIDNDMVVQKAVDPPIAESALQLLWDSNRSVRDGFRNALQRSNKQEFIHSLALSPEEQDTIRKLVVDHYRVMFHRYGRVNSDYSGALSLDFYPRGDQPADYPGRVRHPMSVRLGWTSGNPRDQVFVTYRPALISRTENAYSLMGEASLEFLSPTFSIGPDTVDLARFTIVNLESFSRVNRFSRAPSWRLQASIDREPQTERYFFEGQFGLGFGFGPESVLMFLLPAVEARSVEPHMIPVASVGGVLRIDGFRLAHQFDTELVSGVVSVRESMSRASIRIQNRLQLQLQYDFLHQTAGFATSLFF